MDCNIIQEKMINGIIELEGDFLDDDVRMHIDECDSCRSFYGNLLRIQADYKAGVEIPDIESKKEKLFCSIVSHKRRFKAGWAVAAGVIVALIMALFYLYVYTQTHIPAFMNNQNNIDIVYYNSTFEFDEIDTLTELPGDLYLSGELENLTDKEFAMLLHNIEAELY